MALGSIGTLFAKNISRRIEEVIKVDQTDEDVIGDEIAEYVVTDSIRSHYDQILDLYWETPKKPHEGIAVWVSGFWVWQIKLCQVPRARTREPSHQGRRCRKALRRTCRQLEDPGAAEQHQRAVADARRDL